MISVYAFKLFCWKSHRNNIRVNVCYNFVKKYKQYVVTIFTVIGVIGLNESLRTIFKSLASKNKSLALEVKCLALKDKSLLLAL